MIDLRTPRPPDLPALSALNLRSKAYWGYDAAFMAACVEELRVTEADLACSDVIAAFDGAQPCGMAQVTREGEVCDLANLFVDPAAMGRGLGRRLFNWAAGIAEAQGASHMTIEADPNAAPFYRRMGALDVGNVPSGSIPGRVLPLLHLALPRGDIIG